MASIAMCDWPASSLTGAPTSANDPVSAQASMIRVSRGSSTEIAGASSSYPVSESSGNTTTRAFAERTAAACDFAFVATSYDTHNGWATAMTSASRTLNTALECQQYGPR